MVLYGKNLDVQSLVTELGEPDDYRSPQNRSFCAHKSLARLSACPSLLCHTLRVALRVYLAARDAAERRKSVRVLGSVVELLRDFDVQNLKFELAQTLE